MSISRKTWYPACEGEVQKGQLVKNQDGRTGRLVGLSMDGRIAVVEEGNEIKTYPASKILIRKDRPLTELQVQSMVTADQTMAPADPNDPTMRRITAIRYRIAQLQEELGKLLKKQNQEAQRNAKIQQQQPRQQVQQPIQQPQPAQQGVPAGGLQMMRQVAGR